MKKLLTLSILCLFVSQLNSTEKSEGGLAGGGAVLSAAAAATSASAPSASAQSGSDVAKELKLFAGKYNLIDSKSGLTGLGAGASGFLSSYLLRRFGMNKNLALNAVRIILSALIPGLIAADFLDDGKLNASVLKGLVVNHNVESLKNLVNCLISKAGLANVMFSGVGVFAEEFLSNR